jgi:pimeloyl-ACP methyl ester carboxylesterase
VSDLFCRLLENTLDEILLREPGYLSRFAVGAPTAGPAAEVLSNGPVAGHYRLEEIQQSIEKGLACFAGKGVKLQDSPAAPDPVGWLLARASLDAFSVARGDFPLAPCPPAPASLQEVLNGQYEERRTAGGARYFIRRVGRRPLVLITAVGIPLEIWSRFLADPGHEFRVIVVESRCADLLAGGLRNFSTLADDADDISSVLQAEALDQVDLLGWCNGGRLAIEMAARCAAVVRSLVLLSPALSGFRGVPARPSRYEAGMKKVFSVLSAKPALAKIYVKTLEEQPPDWAALTDAAARAAVLFALPPLREAAPLRAPMAQAESLLNYGRRLASDAASPVDEALARIQQPAMLITGDDDSQVNNEFTLAALATRPWNKNLIHAAIRGAGHYAHLLQYPYFLSLLQQFLPEQKAPLSSARTEVRLLA